MAPIRKREYCQFVLDGPSFLRPGFHTSLEDMHMMIDAGYQHNGYGYRAMEECLAYIKTKPFGVSDRVVLTCNKLNWVALRLYTKLGFSETGIMDDDEIELALTLECDARSDAPNN